MLRFKLTSTQQGGLLHYLKRNYPLDNFPATYKTLFNIPKTPIETILVSPGQYYHFGIVIGLQSYCPTVFFGKTEIVVDIGIDGFSISKSSKLCGWPIMGYMVDSNLPPFLIGLYVGHGDPNSFNDFLQSFCVDAHQLMTQGFNLISDGPHFNFKIRVFSVDTAARSKLTATKSNCSRSGCHKCDQHSTKKTYNFFQTTVGNLRTDISFSQ